MGVVGAVTAALAALGGLFVLGRPAPEAAAAPASAAVLPGPVAAPLDASAVPVVVELFTSEGCSSCPPADAVLARLERTQPVPGARVVPLGLHVDTWDRLGWPDPFSSAEATARQRAYAPLGAGTYTPQAVIDGRAETVGSRGKAVELAVADAAKRPHAKVAVELARGATATTLPIAIRVGALPPGAADDAEALYAVTQTGARVAVSRGENAGSTLEHTAIARALGVVGRVPLAGAELDASVKLPPSLTPEEARALRVVVFVQERASRHVLGAATREIPVR